MLYYEGSPMLNYMSSMSESLSKSLKYNPPMFISNMSNELDAINRENEIYILDDIDKDLNKSQIFV
jgi:hypothetical protein